METITRNLIVLFCLALLTACAGQRANPPLLEAEVIRVVTAPVPAERSLGGVTEHRGEGMVIGAAGGTLAWLDACGSGVGSDPSGLGIALCLFFTPVATVGGSLYGLAMADDGAVVAPRVAIAEGVLGSFSEESIAAAVGARLARLDAIEVAVKRPPSRTEHLRLEIADVQLRTSGLSVDSSIALHLQVTARALDHVGRSLREETFALSTPERPLEEWVAGDPTPLAGALARLRSDLAAEIVERWFLRRDVKLVARSPRPSGFFGTRGVTSRTPAFAWRFDGPDRVDVEGFDVRYDFTLVGGDSGPVTVSLTEPDVRLPEPLEACREFQWSVRASWNRYGDMRSRDLAGRAQRFRTPCDD